MFLCIFVVLHLLTVKINIMRKLSSLILAFLLYFGANAQVADWKFSYSRTSNTEIELRMTIAVPKGFHMYSFDQGPGGPIAAKISYNLPSGVQRRGALLPLTEVREYFDDVFKITIRDFGDTSVWMQRFSVPASRDVVISGTYSYQLCMDDGVCITPFPEDFSIKIPAAVIHQEVQEEPEEIIEDTVSLLVDTLAVATIEEPIAVSKRTSAAMKAFWLIFISGFLAGLLAVITPCVFPMIPMTVSLFVKRNNAGIRDALVFGAAIIGIYVTLGILITLIFGDTALNSMASSVFFNSLFFVIFVFFALSLLGAFELTLPSSWVNFMDKKADSAKGLASVFFMAFTLVLVSFSCTAPIIGSLLVGIGSAQTASLFGPAIGMLGFSIALALPFTLLAVFPSALKSIPKSGGWMHSVKVVLGFLVLAFSLYFISKADMVAGWGILSRDLYIAIWIVIFAFMGLYLLGKIRFYADDILSHISLPRFSFAFIAFTFAVYLVPGLFGAPLHSLSGIMPPVTYQKFDLYTPTLQTSGSSSTSIVGLDEPIKYADVFSCPHNLVCFFDYEQGMEYAKRMQKPVFLDFTGIVCANCKKVEMNVWPQPDILKLLSEEYVIISLYVDSRTPLPEDERVVETHNGREYRIETIGQKWSFLMMKEFNTIAVPLYVVLDNDGSHLVEPISYADAIRPANFLAFLQQGLSLYTKQ